MPHRIIEHTKSAALAAAMAILYLASSLAISSNATAASKVVLETDRAKIIRLAGKPATIIVGNPLYASISVKGKMLIVQGKHFGSTNAIIMDEDGNTLAEMDITVIADRKPEHLTVYRRGKQESYDCTATCEGYIRVGDDGEFTKAFENQIQTKTKTATAE